MLRSGTFTTQTFAGSNHTTSARISISVVHLSVATYSESIAQDDSESIAQDDSHTSTSVEYAER